MSVEVFAKYLSTLPEDDTHPYRTGAWRPQTTEWDATDLRAVEGEIPDGSSKPTGCSPRTRPADRCGRVSPNRWSWPSAIMAGAPARC